MKKIYTLTAFNIKKDYCIEKQYFTTYEQANKQRSLLHTHLFANNNININNIERLKDIDTFILDSTFSTNITAFNLLTEASPYI